MSNLTKSTLLNNTAKKGLFKAIVLARRAAKKTYTVSKKVTISTYQVASAACKAKI